MRNRGMLENPNATGDLAQGGAAKPTFEEGKDYPYLARCWQRWLSRFPTPISTTTHRPVNIRLDTLARKRGGQHA